jgi:hypothetical protein
VSPPSDAEPALLPCPACEGEHSAGCPACGGAGHTEITSCPARLVPADVVEVCRLVKLVDKAGLPVAGGTLDQTTSFNAAMTAYLDDRAMWEAERLKRARVGTHDQ